MADSGDRLLGVILAAGKGTRMYPFSDTLPKPVLPVCNRPLLALQLELMRQHGIREVIIVVGHLGYAIVDALGDGSREGVSIRYIQQDETLGMAHAVGKLEPYVHSPFLLLLGDIYLGTDDLTPLIRSVQSGESNAYLATKLEPDPEMVKRNFAVFEGAEDRVIRVIEKPRYVRSSIKGCGLYIFDQTVFDAIRRTPRTAMRDEYEITDSIQIMINDGHLVRHRPVVHHDMNVTFPDDLLQINLIELRKRKLDRLIAAGAQLPDGMVVERSVIGEGASFAAPIRLSNSLAFPGARMEKASDQDHVILYGGTVIPCEHNPPG